jgi:hypothetical protein
VPAAEDILASFSEFATVPDAQPTFLALAEKRTADLPAWNDDEDLRNIAVALRTAHMMKMNGLGSGSSPGAGPVSSESIGSLSVSYAVGAAAAGDSDLSQTTYGRQLAELIAENFIAPMTNYAG